MSWSGLTLCTDADLGALEPEAISGAWKAVTWANQRAEAKRDLKIWLETDYPLVPGVADRIRDTYAPDVVLAYTAGLYTDVTDVAGDLEEEDLTLSGVFATAATDKLYLGFPGEADGLAVKMLDSFNAVASVLTVKYSGAAGWTTLTATNGTIATAGKTFSGSGRITWTVPTDWQRRTLHDDSAYFWIELTVSVALTAGTAITSILQIKPPDGLKRIVAYRALGYIYKNLAAQAPSVDYWGGRAQNQFKTGYWDLADALYATMRDKGGIPIDLDQDDVIDPGESNITSPIRIGRA